MQINLNDLSQFTEDNVKKLLGSGDDNTHTQLRVTKTGIAYLSKVIGAEEIDNLAFRLESWVAGNEYVGPKAAADSKWVQRIFECLRKNWPNPSDTHIDRF